MTYEYEATSSELGPDDQGITYFDDSIEMSTLCAPPIIGDSVSGKHRDQLVAGPSKSQQPQPLEEHTDQNSTLEGFPYCVENLKASASAPTEEQRGRGKDRNTWRKKIRSLSRKRSQPLMRKDEESCPVPQLPSSHQKPSNNDKLPL